MDVLSIFLKCTSSDSCGGRGGGGGGGGGELETGSAINTVTAVVQQGD